MMTHTVPDRAKLVEGLYVEPGALISSSVQHHTHGVLLQKCWQTFVHCQVLVAFQVEKLSRNIIEFIYRHTDCRLNLIFYTETLKIILEVCIKLCYMMTCVCSESYILLISLEIC